MHTLLDRPRDTSSSHIGGTDSFRLGSRMLSFGDQEWGGNRQNIEKVMRKIWRADKGFLLCQVDQAGAEALVVAYLCNSGKYRSLFKNGIKPHSYIALKLFSKVWKEFVEAASVDRALSLDILTLASSIEWKAIEKFIRQSDDWEPKKRYYHFSKKTVHAGSYGMMENRFRQVIFEETQGVVQLTNEEATRFLAGFHNEFPEIRQWHGRTLETLQQKRQLRNLLGFPFNVTDYINPNDIKDLIAWVPQSTVACITRQAYVKLYNFIKKEKLNWHLLNDCHDSYCAEAPENEILDLARKMKEFIEIELTSPVDGEKFRMKSSASIGVNWSPKKDSNPDGLVEIKL